MSAAVHKLRPSLRRAIVIREADANRWRVEGYELLAGRWRFTWLLVPATTIGSASQQAEALAQAMGLPVARKALGERFTFRSGVLGRSPNISTPKGAIA